MFNFPAPLPLTLYVHLPWCAHKCPYCDFNSHALKDALPEGDYVEALGRDLEQDLPLVQGRPIQAVILGGGTPSLFSPETIERLLSGVRARLVLAPDCEITLEANPGTVDYARFAGFRQAGVNRLSIGVQSFDSEKLRALGRIHDGGDAVRAVKAARSAGFDNFNLDLMFGLPQQTVAQALSDMHTAIDLGPTHLSVYQLTIEPNTLFHAHPPLLPDDDAIWEMQREIQAVLRRDDYRQYEVSAYARAGNQCRHNLNYWRFGDYAGIGAGAHAKLTVRNGTPSAVIRLVKQRQPAAYLETAGKANNIVSKTMTTPPEVVFEFMLNALRLTRGFPRRLFTERTGLAFELVEQGLYRAELRGLLRVDDDTVRATALGRRFLNDLVQIFLPAEPANQAATSGCAGWGRQGSTKVQ